MVLKQHRKCRKTPRKVPQGAGIKARAFKDLSYSFLSIDGKTLACIGKDLDMWNHSLEHMLEVITQTRRLCGTIELSRKSKREVVKHSLNIGMGWKFSVLRQVFGVRYIARSGGWDGKDGKDAGGGQHGGQHTVAW